MCVCVCLCLSSLVCMVEVIFVYVDTVLGFHDFFFFFFFNLSWMFQHDCLDTCSFECLICMCFVFLYLHLLSSVEQVSHRKAL